MKVVSLTPITIFTNITLNFNDPVTSKNKKAWFKVDDVTSLTKEEENKQQQITKEKIRQSM